MKTDKLIDLLAQDSAVRWKIGRILGFATIGGAVIAGAAFFIGIGFRSDIASAVETVRFLFKFVVTLSLATAAIGALLRIARPGAPLGLWGWAFAAAPVLLGGAVIAELVAVPESAWAARLVGQNSRFCLTLIPLSGDRAARLSAAGAAARRAEQARSGRRDSGAGRKRYRRYLLCR